MNKIKINIERARNLARVRSLINSRETKEVLDIISKLGYLQIDTISVVQRAHHIALWNRNLHYEKSMLHKLQAEDRKIFEYWSHAASYIPMEDYRYYLPLMKSYFDPMQKWVKDRFEKVKHIMPEVYARVEKEGPLSSRDFKNDGNKKGRWWEWKPAKSALEMLFWQGKLMITERKNFQRIYDLSERVLPLDIDKTIPDETEIGLYFVKKALNGLGIATEKEIIEYFSVYSKSIKQKAIQQLIESAEIMELSIEGINETYYSSKEILRHIDSPIENEIFILSPFDNFTINRKRLLSLFDFEYSLECYVPEKKRKYGYFVHPIFYNNQFIGRLDPKADRKSKTLIVKSLYIENLKIDDDFLLKFKKRLQDFASFNGCDEIQMVNIVPSKYKQVFLDLL